jgi:uncharacterized protein YkwD
MQMPFKRRPGWSDDAGWREGGRRFRVLLGALATILVVASLGAYGEARLHHGTTVSSLQDAASSLCPKQSARSGAGADDCGAASAGTAGAVSGQAERPGAPAAAGKSQPDQKTRAPRRHQRQPRPTPPPRTHTPAPAPSTRPAPTPAPSSSAPTGTSSESAADQVLALINQARGQAGLTADTISSGLNDSSGKHTALMASGCGLSHQCPGEASLGDRLSAAGVHWTSAGENIGEGGPEPDTSADIAKMAVGLTQSMLAEKPPNDGHRLNILSSSFHHLGIAVFRDSGGTIWMTQDFSN